MRGLASFSLLALFVACGEPPTAATLPEPDVSASLEATSAQPSFQVTGSEATDYILIVERDVVESDLAASVEAAGGTLKAFYPFGVAGRPQGVAGGVEGRLNGLGIVRLAVPFGAEVLDVETRRPGFRLRQSSGADQKWCDQGCRQRCAVQSHPHV